MLAARDQVPCKMRHGSWEFRYCGFKVATDSVIPRQSMSSPFESEIFIPESSLNHEIQRECRC